MGWARPQGTPPAGGERSLRDGSGCEVPPRVSVKDPSGMGQAARHSPGAEHAVLLARRNGRCAE